MTTVCILVVWELHFLVWKVNNMRFYVGWFSALIRHNKPGVAAFRLANGYAALTDALGSENVRFQRYIWITLLCCSASFCLWTKCILRNIGRKFFVKKFGLTQKMLLS